MDRGAWWAQSMGSFLYMCVCVCVCVCLGQSEVFTYLESTPDYNQPKGRRHTLIIITFLLYHEILGTQWILSTYLVNE